MQNETNNSHTSTGTKNTTDEPYCLPAIHHNDDIPTGGAILDSQGSTTKVPQLQANNINVETRYQRMSPHSIEIGYHRAQQQVKRHSMIMSSILMETLSSLLMV